jgi:guanyl-specific ribonuclease Sa
MAKTVGFGKLQREMLSNERLPLDVRLAVIGCKNQIKTGRGLTVFDNREGGLPRVAAGQAYYEYQVGQAHQGDAQARGKRRLVALVDAGRNVLRLYFTDSHYTLGEWRQLQYP